VATFLFGGFCPASALETAAGPWWSYRVEVFPGAWVVGIEARFSPVEEPRFVVSPEAAPRIRQLEVAVGADRWRAVHTSLSGAWIRECRAGCRLRYRLELASLARERDEIEIAAVRSGLLVTSPAAWLVHPERLAREGWYRLEFSMPPGSGVACGADAYGEDAFLAEIPPVWTTPYCVLGSFRRWVLPVGESVVEIAMAPGTLAAGETSVVRWIAEGALAVAVWLGRFPVPRTLAIVLPEASSSRIGGIVKGGGGASVVFSVGGAVRREELLRDPAAAHEFVHLAVPTMPLRQLWVTEGLATYVAPLARARAGIVPPDSVWAAFFEGMHRGEPGEEEAGLDGAEGPARRYWGGALFWLWGDLELRRRTEGRRSLEGVLADVVASGASIAHWGTADRFFAALDRAAGEAVFERLYGAMGRHPAGPRTAMLWRDLGVRVSAAGRVEFDDGARLARWRRAVVSY
jgi:hypothetical protein